MDELLIMDLTRSYSGKTKAHPMRLGEVDCHRCGNKILYQKQEQDSYYSKEANNIIESFHEMHEDIINDLDEMFPSVPIKEYLNERSREMIRGLGLLKKGVEGSLSFEEECELENILRKIKP